MPRPSEVHRHLSDNTNYEIISADTLPKEPSAVIVTDWKGKPRWTVSIPSRLQFPLQPIQYREVCRQIDEVKVELDRIEGIGANGRKSSTDLRFVDVREAVQRGFLPGTPPGSVMQSADHNTTSHEPLPPCRASLTFILASNDAGFGDTMLHVWLAYGLAKMEKRTFFIDDSAWAYGKWNTYFEPLPAATCAPAAPPHRLPCSPSAAHVVVSSATAQWFFASGFEQKYGNTWTPKRLDQHRIFRMVRSGYDALFKLADKSDEGYIEQRASIISTGVREKDVVSVGLHVRRGDRRPLEVQFQNDYIPLARYLEEVNSVIVATARSTDAAQGTHTTQLPVYLASDDPDLYASPEFSDFQRAQNRIKLASRAMLRKHNPIKSTRELWIDDLHGWEGGFFRDQFFGLASGRENRFGVVRVLKDVEGFRRANWRGPSPVGKFKDMEQGPLAEEMEPRAKGLLELDLTPVSGLEQGNDQHIVHGLAVEHDDIATSTPDLPTAEALQLRTLIARSYILDLAVLSRTDTVVCTASSAGCRVLAVMMGWEKAIKKRKWRNIDGGVRGWRGIVTDQRQDVI